MVIGSTLRAAAVVIVAALVVTSAATGVGLARVDGAAPPARVGEAEPNDDRTTATAVPTGELVEGVIPDGASGVDYGHIAERDNGTASVTFTVDESCENVTLSLVAYSLPGETFEFETAAQQELLDGTTETFVPGEHTITVELPDSDEEDDE